MRRLAAAFALSLAVFPANAASMRVPGTAAHRLGKPASLPAHWDAAQRQTFFGRLDGYLTTLGVNNRLAHEPDAAVAPLSLEAVAAVRKQVVQDVRDNEDDAEIGAAVVITAYLHEPKMRRDMWAALAQADATGLPDGLKARVVSRMDRLESSLERINGEQEQVMESLSRASSKLLQGDLYSNERQVFRVMASLFDGAALAEEVFGPVEAIVERPAIEEARLMPADIGPPSELSVQEAFLRTVPLAIVSGPREEPADPVIIVESFAHALGVDHWTVDAETAQRLRQIAAVARRVPEVRDNKDEFNQLYAALVGVARRFDGIIGPVSQPVLNHALNTVTRLAAPEDLYSQTHQIPYREYSGGPAATFDWDEKGGAFVDWVEPGGSAERAGLRIGDWLLEVDGEELFSNGDIILAYGEEGASMSLRVARGDDIFEVEVPRESLPDRGHWSLALEGGVVYAGFNDFDDDSLELLRSLNDRGTNKRLHGVILDLRDNAGGERMVLRQWLSSFARKGEVIDREIDASGFELTVTAERDGPLAHIPVMALINGNTASSAEGLAGFVQDYGHGILIGETSYGKYKGQSKSFLDLMQDGLLEFAVHTFNWIPPLGWMARALRLGRNALIPDVRIREGAEAAVARRWRVWRWLRGERVAFDGTDQALAEARELLIE